jgi:hypothetical protein
MGARFATIFLTEATMSGLEFTVAAARQLERLYLTRDGGYMRL